MRVVRGVQIATGMLLMTEGIRLMLGTSAVQKAQGAADQVALEVRAQGPPVHARAVSPSIGRTLGSDRGRPGRRETRGAFHARTVAGVQKGRGADKGASKSQGGSPSQLTLEGRNLGKPAWNAALVVVAQQKDRVARERWSGSSRAARRSRWLVAQAPAENHVATARTRGILGA